MTRDGVCVVCGATFLRAATGALRLTCSARCRDEKYRRAKGVPPRKPAELIHGGPGSGYERGCRCDECRAAHAARKKRLRTSGRTPPAHGLSGYQNFGCRCEVCSAAKSAENRRRYVERVARDGAA